jgi:hypothetical protein
MAKIPVRDGRRERELAPDGKGIILGTTERGNFLDIGDKIDLPDGAPVIVIGCEEVISNAASSRLSLWGVCQKGKPDVARGSAMPPGTPGRKVTG